MKIFDIIKKVGGVALNFVPGGGPVLSAVNAFLGPDDQLPPNATGHQLGAAVATLSGTEKASLMEKEFDVQITEIKEGNETLRAMIESDASNPQSTRPYIAKHCFHSIALTSLIAVLAWFYGVVTEKEVVINAVSNGWPFLVAINTPQATVLLSYFGNLVREQKNKMDATNGSTTPNGLAGIASMIFKK